MGPGKAFSNTCTRKPREDFALDTLGTMGERYPTNFT